MLQLLRRAALSVAVALFAFGAAPSNAADTLRIPLMDSFSGQGADWVDRLWSGAVVGQDMVNAAGGIKGRMLELYKADAPFDDMPQAVSMFRKLARDQENVMVFDGGATTVVAAVHDLAEEYEVPLFAFTSGGRWRLPGFNPWVFRSLPMPESAIPVLWEKGRAKWNINKAALFYAIDDEKSVPNANVFKELAQRDGVELLELRFKSKETDFAAQLTQTEAADVDVLLITAQSFEGGLISLQAKEMGLDQPILGDISLAADDYLELSKGKVGSLADGNPSVFYGVYNRNDQRPFVQDMITAYREKWGKDPDAVAARGAEGVLILAQVLNRTDDLTREGIREVFSSSTGIETLSGVIHWEGSGDAKRRETLLLTWEDGAVVPVPDEFWK